ncbi:enkurin-like [Neocloeon triangulifer]|uniref:enkurin-like n=1 Tax=Neocloeon triangulifer TaxID=2078957 RepID=UPI00286F2104|nr:enkurin-like [Neocloeon triangulifer]
MSSAPEEKIQDIVERAPPKPYKMKRHKSAHRDRVVKENEYLKKARSTMGNAEEPLPEPCNFLKKYSRKELKKETDEPRCLLNSLKPPLPRPACIHRRDEKNFLADNIQSIPSVEPKYTKPKVVDSYNGNLTTLRQPKYIFKTNYGKSPGFAKRLKKKPAESSSKGQDTTMQMMSHEERSKLIKNLEKSLNDKNSEFLLMPVIIDTPYLINKKKKLEKEIAQIEEDLQLISSNFDIYISDD